MRILVGLVMVLGLGAAEGRRDVDVARRPGGLPYQKRIAGLLRTEAGQSARWGILARSLKTGRTVFALNADDHMAPASNTKLFSTALALERLGPEYRFVTTVRADRAIDGDGVLVGDLRLVGGGDPTLSGRAYPYQKEKEGGDPIEPVVALAEQLAARGLKEVRGSVVGDDRRYVYQPFPEGWTLGDALWEYGAPVSALTFNDNAFTVRVQAGEVGDLARVFLNPPSVPFVVDNRVMTVGEKRGKLEVDRTAGSRQLRLSGTVGSGGARQLLAVDDPALYAAAVFHDVLTRRGVRITGEPGARHRYRADEPFDAEYGVELARRESLPLTEVARVVNKVSQNLHAELLLREVGLARQTEGTREAGLRELDVFLKEVGVEEKEYHFEDGSGLSRRGIVSPAAIVKLLTYMDSRPYGAEWDKMLPFGGEDGTLRSRFEKAEAARVIHAKTGTLGTVSALSGYVTTKRGVRLVFSVIANNYTAPGPEVRKVIDRIGLALAAWEGQ